MDVDSQTPPSASRQTAELLIDSCLREGVDHFFVAPGSRCTPLTMAVADRADAQVIQHFDERGLAYACVGYARATGRPGAFICTSGTAVANAYPAVVESSQDHVPLLLLTADRPPELRDTGANQTIDQVKAFADFTRWFIDLPCPGPELTDRFWRSAVAHAVNRTQGGPVQLNCMFREPFDTRDMPRPEQSPIQIPPPIRPDAQIAWQVPAGRTLVIAGGCRPSEAIAARRLAERIECPFLADVTSGLRGLNHDLLLMRNDAPSADVIIHVGGRIVSKRWLQFVAANPPQHYLHLTPFLDRLDPLHHVTQVIRGPLISLCDGARTALPSPADFAQAWSRCSRLSQQAANDVLDAQSAINEPELVRVLAAELPTGNGLLLGNSLPIREWDTFGHPEHDRPAPGQVAANRGASGIDGLIATATGFAVGLKQPTTALIGDLSALHDLNSLAMVAASPIPVVLVVINNDGGGIFHFLPVAAQKRSFERFFATPHGRNFADAARMFGLAYDRPTSKSQFLDAYRRACRACHSSLIEIQTDRRQTRELYRQIEKAVREASA